jgi:hypothetical protein
MVRPAMTSAGRSRRHRYSGSHVAMDGFKRRASAAPMVPLDRGSAALPPPVNRCSVGCRSWRHRLCAPRRHRSNQRQPHRGPQQGRPQQVGGGVGVTGDSCTAPGPPHSPQHGVRALAPTVSPGDPSSRSSRRGGGISAAAPSTPSAGVAAAASAGAGGAATGATGTATASPSPPAVVPRRCTTAVSHFTILARASISAASPSPSRDRALGRRCLAGADARPPSAACAARSCG